MKKFVSLILGTIFVLTLTACGKSNFDEVYSFSGENDVIRVVNGSAKIGGGKQIFDGGKIEPKTEDFTDLTMFCVEFYLDDGEENWTIRNSSFVSKSGTFKLDNLKLGQMEGTILNTNMERDVIKDNLYIKISLTHEDGSVDTITMPMEVVEENNN